MFSLDMENKLFRVHAAFFVMILYVYPVSECWQSFHNKTCGLVLYLDGDVMRRDLSEILGGEKIFDTVLHLDLTIFRQYFD